MAATLCVFAPLIVLAAATPAGGSSEVEETRSTFSCCRVPVIHLDQSCENVWTVGNTTFAYSSPPSSEGGACTSPCGKVKGGEMTLARCVDVTVTTVCKTQSVVVERRTHYRSQACPGPRSDAAGRRADAAALTLLVLLSSARFVEETTP